MPMNRRRALQIAAATGAAALFHRVAEPLGIDIEAAGPAHEATPALKQYQSLRFGCSFHFGMPNFTGNDYDVGRAPASTYNPTHLDVRQWIRVAHDLGARYAILVAKYMSGFCLWPAKGYDYSLRTAATRLT